MTITAEGTKAANGSFDALSVTGFQFRAPQPGNHKLPGNPKPGSSPATNSARRLTGPRRSSSP